MEQFFSEYDKEILSRFAKSRQESKKNPFRPLYHFATAEGGLNDPNGLCFWNGKWHLFFQGGSPTAANPSWGHTFSTDLIHWKDLPYAIDPGPEVGSWSGATWVEEDRVIAMYHGFKLGNMVATSSEPDLVHWEKVTNDTVIPLPLPIFTPANGSEKICGENVPEGALNIVYDPCIWKKGEYYYSISGGAMVEGSAKKRRRTAFLYRSKDLAHWEYLHNEFIQGDVFGSPGDDLGCPYFVPIADKYMLLHYSHRRTSHYLIGDYDKEHDRFIVTSGGDIAFGPTIPGGILAPSAYPDGKGGVFVIFNVSTGHFAPDEAHRQMLSLPRRLTLEDGELRMEPVESVKTLRKDHKGFRNMELPANEKIVLDGYEGNAIELEMEIDTGNSQVFELEVLRSPDCKEVTKIRFYRERGCRDWDRTKPGESCFTSPYDCILSIDTAESSILPDVKPRMPENAPFYLPHDENLKLNVFIDKSIVEVFANGRQCAAVRVYPGLAESKGIALYSRNGDSKVLRFDLWQMDSIYE